MLRGIFLWLTAAILLLVAGLVGPANALPEPFVQIEIKEDAEFSGVSVVRVLLRSTPGVTEPPVDLGHFSFLIEYNASRMEFLSASAGQILADCGWESFQWEEGPDADCGGIPCPSNVIRVTATADLENGNSHPTCFPDSSSTLVTLYFEMTANSVDDECSFFPIDFAWYDCNDNVVAANSTTDSLIISDTLVFPYYYIQPPVDSVFPTGKGAPESCLALEDKLRIRGMSYMNGGGDPAVYLIY